MMTVRRWSWLGAVVLLLGVDATLALEPRTEHTFKLSEGTLSLKVKHFNPDFTAWEEKDDFVNFRLVKLEENALHFSGLSFYRRDENHIDAYIVLREGDEISEHELKYVRSSH